MSGCGRGSDLLLSGGDQTLAMIKPRARENEQGPHKSNNERGIPKCRNRNTHRLIERPIDAYFALSGTCVRSRLVQCLAETDTMSRNPVHAVLALINRKPRVYFGAI
jgi:hypothetical protein